MSTITEVIDDNLTTDACPSLPREEIEDIRNDLNEGVNVAENIHQIPRFHKINGNKKSKQKKKIPTGPIANIINIANCNGVQIGQNYTINVGKKEKKDNFKETVVKTEAINRLFECKDPVSRDNLMFVSTHVGEGWRDIGRSLKYSDGQIYQFEETHMTKGVKEVVYQLLLDWIQSEPQDAIIAKLTEVLWDCGQESVVKLLSEKL